MDIYKVKKGNVEFYIQPEMAEAYSMMGYEVYKLVETLIEDVEAEAKTISAEIEKNSNIKIKSNEE